MKAITNKINRLPNWMRQAVRNLQTTVGTAKDELRAGAVSKKQFNEFIEQLAGQVVDEWTGTEESNGEEWCDRCDGCSWHEGGKTLKTNCAKYGGTGRIVK